MSLFSLNRGARVALMAAAMLRRAAEPVEQAAPEPLVPTESSYLARRDDESRQAHRARVRAYHKGRAS